MTTRRDHDLNTADAPLINGALLGAPWQADDVADLDLWADDPERTPAAFCDVYAVHEPHAYRALNRNTYLCPGFTDDDLGEVERLAAEPLCEHGLSAWLCAGPNHYPSD